MAQSSRSVINQFTVQPIFPMFSSDAISSSSSSKRANTGSFHCHYVRALPLFSIQTISCLFLHLQRSAQFKQSHPKSFRAKTRLQIETICHTAKHLHVIAQASLRNPTAWGLPLWPGGQGIYSPESYQVVPQICRDSTEAVPKVRTLGDDWTHLHQVACWRRYSFSPTSFCGFRISRQFDALPIPS